MKPLTALVATAVLAATSLVHADEISLEECPPAVQATIRANAKGGRLDEINLNRSVYEAEIKLTGGRERDIRVAANGRLLFATEDFTLAQLPKAVRRTVDRLTPSDGRVDDIDRETTPGRVVYRVEIDRAAGRDFQLLLSNRGSVLRN